MKRVIAATISVAILAIGIAVTAWSTWTGTKEFGGTSPSPVKTATD